MAIKIIVKPSPQIISNVILNPEDIPAISYEVPMGRKGDKGDKGDEGKSAYQSALDNGFIGTDSEWLLSIKGEKGDTGLQGLQGIQGVQGIKGDSGTNGVDGSDGYTPVKGVDYFDGAQGAKGDTGEQGLKGDKGDTGLQGIQGNTGYTPIKGIDYFDGQDGEQGIQGLKGDKGDKGDTGERGADGTLPESELRDITNTMSTSLLVGGIISINADNTKFDISAGSGMVVNNYTDTLHPTKTLVTWDNLIAQTTPYLATSTTTSIGIDINGNVVLRDVDFTDIERRDIIVLGWVDHFGTSISAHSNEPMYGGDIQAQVWDFLESFGSFNIEGNDYFPHTGLQIRKTAGRTFDTGSNYQTTKKSPNIHNTDAIAPVDIYYYYRDTDWVNDSDVVSVIDPNNYDTGLGLASVPFGKFTIQIVGYYSSLDSTDIQYGQVVYDDMASAKSALNDPVVINPYNSFDTFRAWIIVKQGATDLTDQSQAMFVSAGKLGLFSIASGGGSGGEVNTATNVGLTGQGLYLAKSGVNLEFKNISANSNKISITNDVANKSVDIDIVPSNILLSELSSDSTHRLVTDSDLTKLSNLSGTNSGDETASTIKSKLGITTLSGNNTGDQDLTVLVPKTTTVNGHALGGNITITKTDLGLENVSNVDTSITSNISDVTSKRFVSDTEKSTWNSKEPAVTKATGFNLALSTTATDIKMNGTQSLGTASTLPRADHVHPSDTSKQATLVSGTNIKTINGTSVLGSGNLVISGSGEANTSSNSGAGVGLAKSKVGVDLPFKSLIAGTNITIDDSADSITINSTGGSAVIPDVIEITAVATPSTPTVGKLKLFAKNRAGRTLLNQVGASGLDTPFQPALFGNTVYMWLAGATTAASIAFGTTWTARNASGAQSHPTKTTTNLLTSMNRALYSCTATTATSSGIVSTNTVAVRGNQASMGGFYAMFRFGVETYSGAGQQIVVGLTGVNTALAAEPSALTNMVALTKDSTETTWQLCFRNASTLTKINTGETITAGRIYDLTIFCKPNDTKITVRLVRMNDGVVILDDVEYEQASNNLPVNTTFMYANVQLRNTGTAINALALNRIYVETDL